MSKRLSRRSSPPTEESNKKARTEDDEDEQVNLEWVDNPQIEDGISYYQAVSIRRVKDSASIVVRVGEAVLVHPRSTGWVCRIEKLFEDADGEQKFRGRWFYRATDLERLHGKSSGREEKELQRVLDQIIDKDVVVSNLEEDNPITSIAEPCSVTYQGPEESVLDDPDVEFVCRFRLDWDEKLTTFATSDLDPDAMSLEVTSSEGEASSDDRRPRNGDDSDDGDGSDNGSAGLSHVIQEGEGSVVRGQIMIGPKYQAAVPEFNPNHDEVKSRNPTLIFKPGCISDKELEDFSAELARFHTPFIKSRDLTISEEPYMPVPVSRMEEIKDFLPRGKSFTPSNVSTSSYFLGPKRQDLQKECNVDAVLDVLAAHNFDTRKAIEAIKAESDSVTTRWSENERDIFDDIYRRHPGNLREITKALAPLKTMKDVVDYNYRFKIPELSRRFQDKVRCQAKDIVDAIDRKRRNGTTFNTAMEQGEDGEPLKDSPWQETPIERAVVSASERRTQAKRLLKDVESRLGEQTARKIQDLIVQLKYSFSQKTRRGILSTLGDQPDLQQRFLSFIPRAS